MSVTGIDAFDTTIHKTNIWLNDLMQMLNGIASRCGGEIWSYVRLVQPNTWSR